MVQCEQCSYYDISIADTKIYGTLYDNILHSVRCDGVSFNEYNNNTFFHANILLPIENIELH